MEAQPFKYYRHRYGGLYQVEHIGISTVDKSKHVVYKHIFPFTQEIWIRPIEEWTEERFTLLTADEASDVIRLDRDQLKEEIAANKKVAGK